MASLRVRESKDGEKSYAVLYTHGTKQRSKTFPNRKEALKLKGLIDAWGADEGLRLYNAEKNPGLTLNDLAAKWLEDRRSELTVRVYESYDRDLRKYIGPALGWRPAAGIDETDVQRWIDSIKPKLSPKSVGDKHAILHQIFAWGSAKTRRYVDHNPCKETDLPAKKKPVRKGLRLPELAALTATARSTYPNAADLIDFLAGTGWRLQEALALTVGQVEDDGTDVWVHMTRVWRRGEGYVDGGKSSAAIRRIDILGEAGRSAVRRNVVGKGPGDFVFLAPTGNPWTDTNFRHNYFKPLCRAAGLGDGPTPHWLRHTHVLLCHAAGMTLPEIQKRIGHENIAMTIDVYGKMVGGTTASVRSNADALLAVSSTRPAIDILGSDAPQ